MDKNLNLKKIKCLTIYFFITLFIFSGCERVVIFDMGKTNYSDPNAKEITSFSINSIYGIFDENNLTIRVNLIPGTDITALTPVFNVSGETVQVNSVDVISGSSVLDFSSAVIFTITAINGTIKNYVVTVVLVDIVSIAVTPSAPSNFEINQTIQFTATGTYSDSSTADISAAATWLSSNTAAAIINASGLVSGIGLGVSSISASYSGVSSNDSSQSASLTVNPQTEFYVCPAPTGSDATGNGTLSNPYETISNAITQAGLGSTVYVSQGTYTENVYLKDGIKVYGSYAADFSSRDINATTSNISPDDNSAVCANVAMSNSAIIDGFDIIGSSTGGSAGIELSNNGNPTIQNNKITGGNKPAGPNVGIKINNSSPLIQNNYMIDGGVSSPGNTTDGIYLTGNGSNPIIRNNCIDGGNGDTTYGIRIEGTGTATIQNNTINAGSGSVGLYGIYLNDGTATIQNNIIFNIASATSEYGVYEGTIGSDPIDFNNNNIEPTFAVLFYDNSGGTPNIITAGDLNTLPIANNSQSGNVSEDSLFVNLGGGNWHLSGSSPTVVTQGGMDLSGSFIDDLDGFTRINWSMGAYDY